MKISKTKKFKKIHKIKRNEDSLKVRFSTK